MPKIPEWFNTENIAPSDRGANAWENAARRIPGFYNSAASNERERGQLLDLFYKDQAGNERERGQLDARGYKQQLWPFDIMELYDRRSAQAAQEAARAPRDGGIRFRVVGGVNPEEREIAGIQRANEGRRGYGGYGGGADGAQQISRGAGALGSMLSDGGYSAGRRLPRDAVDGGGGEQLELYHGELVPVSQARKMDRDIAIANQKQLDQYSSDLSDYQRRYYGYDQPARDPNTDMRPGGNGLMQEPGFPMTGSYTGIDPATGKTGAFAPSPSQQGLYRTPQPDPATWNPMTWFGASTYDGVQRRE